MTVSRVLNNKGSFSEETRQHVLHVMRELGYRPNRVARSLATAKTLKIGVVVPSISSAYFGEVLEGTERVLWECGYHMLLCNTAVDSRREHAVMDLFEEDRVDGVVVLSSHLPGDELSSYLKKQRAAVVINCDVEPGIAGHIYTDELKSMRMAVKHLQQAGCKCLGYIGLAIETYAGRERHDMFIRACEEVGLSVSSDNIVICDRRMGGLAARRLFKRVPETDGLICFNDEIAAGALRVCFELQRRVPEDVAIVGFDDIFLAELLVPALTTLRLKTTKQEVGAIAARMLLERIEGRSTRDEVVLEHELVVRESAP
ncbi:MAG: hypothetical protein CL610_07835 [Anaerolineaceae bacterium]|nr:hypothetical protein [Anaerolineaceae bacterium]